MTFADHQAQVVRYDTTAQTILSIACTEKAIGDYGHYASYHGGKWPSFTLESVEAHSNDTVAIKGYAYFGDTTESKTIVVPMAWMDDFDPAVVREYLQQMRATFLEAKVAKAYVEAEKRAKEAKANDFATVRRVLQENPEMLVNFKGDGI